MIRHALPADLNDILDIYALARSFMKQAGNPTQWEDHYPPSDRVEQDIVQGISYVYERDGRVQAVFVMIPGDDPDYAVIKGAWLNDLPYCAIHRVASRGEERGVAAQCLLWALEQCGNIRIDTHADNRPMQRVLEKLGFARCGQIWLPNGSPRVAFQKALSVACKGGVQSCGTD
jgi:RimJ/RimL family protein N-acetyltransferase